MRLHHIGIVVDDLGRRGNDYARHLGLRPRSAIVNDPTQQVRVQFWGTEDYTTIELIEPLGANSPVRGFLEKGGGLNHLCYEVADLEGAVKAAWAGGAVSVCPPVSAPAFDGRRIAFMLFRDIGLIEYVEAPDACAVS